MSNVKATIGNMDSIINDILDEYGDKAKNVMNEETEKAIAKAVTKLRRGSPKRTGEYAKGWKKRTTVKRLDVKGVAYNAKHYRRTHLLENGHQKRGGLGRVPGIPHIAPVNEEIQEEFLKEVKRSLEEMT